MKSLNNNNNNKTVLIKRLPPKSLSAKNTIQTITMYTNIKPKWQHVRNSN